MLSWPKSIEEIVISIPTPAFTIGQIAMSLAENHHTAP